jgi:hypothetical protein
MRALALLLGCLVSSATWAQPLPPKEVSPLVVFPITAPPKIVRAFPAAGQAVAPGVLILSVTFDQAMNKTGFDFGSAPGGQAPDCLKTPRLLDDKRTFVLLCTTHGNRDYAISFNASPEGGFANVAERRAAPATLAFRTNDQLGPRTVGEALKAASLGPLDMPIQDTPGLPRN